MLADRRPRLREHPRGHLRALPRRRLHRPPRPGLLSRRGDARQRGRAGSATSACSRAGAWSPTPTSAPRCSIFGARAAAEIERRRHEVALRAREAEIAASRVRIVEAADEERRRIGRNLHDGAQQRLVALGHMLAMAERRLADEPDSRRPRCSTRRASRRRWRATSCASSCAGCTRPGWPSTASATRWPRWPRARRCRCTLDALPERRLPGAVEATVYYLVSEALTNALKHADATEVRAEVRLAGPAAAGRRPRRRPRRRAGERGHGPRGPGRSRHRGRRDAARREPARGGHAPGGDDHAGARGARRASRSSSSATATTAGWATACSRWCSTGARR